MADSREAIDMITFWLFKKSLMEFKDESSRFSLHLQ